VAEAAVLDELLFPDKTREQILSKLNEEILELKNKTDFLNEVEEIGDVLFLLISYCRVANIAVDTALLATLIKIKDRKKRKNG